MSLRTPIAILSVALFAATVSAAIDVTHDPAASFDSYRTYAWTKGSDARTPQVQIWIVAAVERELEAKGLTRAAEGDDADVLVATHAVATSDLAVSSDYLQGSYGWGIIRADVTQLTQGTLIVDIIDNGTSELVWRGVVSEAVSQDLRKPRRRSTP